MKKLIDENLVKNLIESGFPKYSNLSITPVKQQGHDNRTFHLGNEMLIRVPSSKRYAKKVSKEQEWLPKISPNVSFKIPKPIHIGKPSKDYPYNWSIYEWIPGESLNLLPKDKVNLEEVAKKLAKFIKELHKIDVSGAPKAGKSTFYRGCSPKFYDDDTRNYLDKLRNIIDYPKALKIWENAINSEWEKNPVWIHGDLAIGNILIKDNKVNAIIDFSGMAIGDPACDIVLYWNLFDKGSKDIFRSELDLDKDTWNRARGWALWKASFEIINSENKSSDSYISWVKIIQNIIG